MPELRPSPIGNVMKIKDKKKSKPAEKIKQMIVETAKMPVKPKK
jgi:hypothetical protein